MSILFVCDIGSCISMLSNFVIASTMSDIEYQ